MKQIKTIILPASQAADFDAAVNEAARDGWAIKARRTLDLSTEVSEAFNFSVFPGLYAELERHVPPHPEEVTE